jgi:hypothetical protein
MMGQLAMDKNGQILHIGDSVEVYQIWIADVLVPKSAWVILNINQNILSLASIIDQEQHQISMAGKFVAKVGKTEVS